MTNTLPTVTIAAPVRNREWILNQYLDRIIKIEYPKKLINILFVLNDSTDRSRDILYEFKKNYNNEYNNINIDVYNRNIPNDARVTHIRNEYTYHHLSIIRNYILSKVKTEYLFSIDSDILVPSNILMKLLDAKKDIVSGLIYNGYIIEPSRPYKYTNILKYDSNQVLRHVSNLKTKIASTHDISELLEVDVTGAVYLMKRQVCKKVKYGYDKQGEDVFFCNMAQSKGYRLYCQIGAYCEHIMRRDLL